MGLFKNPDVFSKYVSPLTGLDSSDGSIMTPYATIAKAGLTKILLNGKTTENVNLAYSSSIYITGDNETAEIDGAVQGFSNGENSYLSKLKIKECNIAGGSIVDCYVKNLTQMFFYGSMIAFSRCFVENLYAGKLGNTSSYCKNNTIYNFYNRLGTSSYDLVISNSIFVYSVDLYNSNSRSNLNFIPNFQYCLFRKVTVWKWNGAVIPINYGTYGNAVSDYLADVISGLYAYANAMPAGTDKNYFLAMIPSSNSSNIFYVDLNGQTCKVVEDRPSINGSKKIFNRYVNDAPVDYSLFLDKDNVALTMSDQQSYVGCYKANDDVLSFGAVVNANTDGTDDLGTTPDMLMADGNGKFHVSSADSVQTRNRVRSNVFTFKRGFSLVGFQSQMKSGLGSRFSIGKFQPYNITNAPTLPQESIEVIPYDNATTPSAFPRFSAMFNDVCQMWYHTTGAKVGQPVLFNDLLSFFAITTDKNLTEYGTWAVTNADYETYLLSEKTGVTLKNVPVNFAKVEINLNYYV